MSTKDFLTRISDILGYYEHPLDIEEREALTDLFLEVYVSGRDDQKRDVLKALGED